MKKRYEVPYMARTREYYRAQGYTNDYEWAHNTATPFTPLTKPISECRVGLITTSMPNTESGRSSRQVYSTPVAPIPDSMYTDELSWHQSVTHTRDVASFLPLEQVVKLTDAGKIGGLTANFHSLPTDYSQRNTNENDAPELLRRLREDQADIAILVPL